MSSIIQNVLLGESQSTKDKVLLKLLESLVCSVCHDLMFVPVMTQCGHNYCYDCLTSWFDSNSNELSCPHCRSGISEPPSLNSALQQLLVNMIELVGHKIDREEFSSLLEAKESNEKSYKFDKRNDDLFRGIFKTSAMGVVDEDDDGILRCSNCHWELEDDVGDTCPHCNSRIRSRMTQPRRNESEGEEEEEEEEEDHDDYLDDDFIETGTDTALEDQITFSISTYRNQIVRLVNTLSGNGDDRNRKLLLQGTTPRGDLYYFPSYTIYLATDRTLSTQDQAKRIRMAQDAESTVGGEPPDVFSVSSDENDHMQSLLDRATRSSNNQYSDDEVSEDIDIDDDSDGSHVPRRNREGVIDLEAEVDEDEDEDEVEQGSGHDSGHDSDYYEQHGGGFVSGDSLDDAPMGDDELDDEEDDGGNQDQDQEEDNSDDQHGGQDRSHRRKRFQVVLDSEDE